MTENNHLLLYDGVCHLCNNTVKFVLKNEPTGKVKFAYLQSSLGKKIINDHHLDLSKVDSIFYIKNQKIYSKSTAALWLCLELKFPFSLISGLIIFPAPIRNLVYDYIAKNRYRWFGQSNSCILPDKKFENRFLDI